MTPSSLGQANCASISRSWRLTLWTVRPARCMVRLSGQSWAACQAGSSGCVAKKRLSIPHRQRPLSPAESAHLPLARWLDAVGAPSQRMSNQPAPIRPASASASSSSWRVRRGWRWWCRSWRWRFIAPVKVNAHRSQSLQHARKGSQILPWLHVTISVRETIVITPPHRKACSFSLSICSLPIALFVGRYVLEHLQAVKGPGCPALHACIQCLGDQLFRIGVPVMGVDHPDPLPSVDQIVEAG